jgi:hypothetical protein
VLGRSGAADTYVCTGTYTLLVVLALRLRDALSSASFLYLLSTVAILAAGGGEEQERGGGGGRSNESSTDCSF